MANTAPIVDLNGGDPGTTVTLAYTENQSPTPIAPAVTVSDPDSGNFDGGIVNVGFEVNGSSGDQLTIGNQGTGPGQIGVSGNTVTYGGATIGTFAGGANGGNLVIFFTSPDATPAAVQALIADILYSNNSESPSTLPRTLLWVVTDGDGNANGGSDTAVVTATVDVTIAPPNTPPTITTVNLGGGGTQLDSVGYTDGQTNWISDPYATDPDSGDQQNLTWSIAGGPDGDKFSITTDGSGHATLNWITPPDFDPQRPVFTDGGGRQYNTYNVDVQVDDGHGGTDIQNVTVSVAQNPWFPGVFVDSEPTAVNVDENTTAVTTVTAVDNLGPFSFSIDPNVGDASKFTVDQNGVVSFLNAPNFEGPDDVGTPGEGGQDGVYDVAVIATDNSGRGPASSSSQALRIFVQDVNEAPVIQTINLGGGGTQLDSVGYTDGQTNWISDPYATDPDSGDQQNLTWSIAGGPDGDKFSITTDGSGHATLNWITPPDFDPQRPVFTDGGGRQYNTYNVDVQVDDGHGGTDIQNVTVSVAQNPWFPGVFVDSEPTAVNVDENTTAVTTVTAVDNLGPFSFSIDPNVGDASKFTVDQNGVVSFLNAPNFEGPDDVGTPGEGGQDGVYDVAVIATDNSGRGPASSSSQALRIFVQDVNEGSPVFDGAPGTRIADSIEGYQGDVTTLSATDVDTSQMLIYSIVPNLGDDGDKFVINPATGLVGWDGTKPPSDFENPGSVDGDNLYQLTVQVDDGNGGISTKDVAITVFDNPTDNDTPPAGTNNTVNVVEDVSYTLKATDFGFADADGHNFTGVLINTLPSSPAGVLRLGNTALSAGAFVTAEQIASGMLIYTPRDNVFGNTVDTSFTFSVRDDGPAGVNQDTTPNTLSIDMSSTNFQDYNVTREGGSDLSITFGLIRPNFSVYDYDSDGDGFDIITLDTAAGGATTFTDLNFTRTDNNLEVTWDLGASPTTMTVRDQYVSATAWEQIRFDNGATYAGYSLAAGTANIGGGQAIAGGRDVLAGTAASEVLNGLGGPDLIFGNGGDDVLTGGSGGDLLELGLGSDTVNVSSGESAGVVNTASGGSISGYDVIVDFNPDNDKLNLNGIPFEVSASDTNGLVDGANSTLTIGGTPISQHSIADGVITFYDDSGSLVSLASNQNVAAAVQYLHNNDLGSSKTTMAFDATLSGTPHTFVFQQVGETQSAANDILIDLNGLTAADLLQIEATPPDNTAPDAPVISGLGPDSGTSSVDGLTKIATVTVSGTAEADSAVAVFNGEAQIGTATADENGNWSLADVELSEGANSLAATATDAAGNTGAASGAFVATLDTISPVETSFIATDPSLTNASTVHYTVTFSEPVTGVDASHFTLITSGVSGASIASVTQVSGSNGTQYAIEVNAGTGDGTVKLDFVSAGIKDLAGNQMPGGSYQLSAGYQPFLHTAALALGDVNGDGAADLVVANTGLYIGGNEVSVQLGNGDGTFQSPTTFGTGNAPFSVAIGDLNDDGKGDLVTANAGSNSVSVLLGNGDGTFQPQSTYATGSYPISVVAGDLNGDGNLDLAVGEHFGAASVLLGNGDGTFQSHVTYATSSSPYSIQTADLNGDGNLDLVTANPDAENAGIDATLSVLLGNGDGTFQPQTAYVSTSGPRYFTAIGDLNGDAVPDLVASGAQVSVLLGNGDGTFAAAVDYGNGGPVAIADANGDGNADIITGGELLLGNGDGTFQSSVPLPASGYLAVGDVNGDGRPDVALAHYNIDSLPIDTVSVLLNTPPTIEGDTYTIDNTAPAAPVVSGVAPDSGSSSSDGTTNSATVTANGTAEANSTVAVFNGGTQIGTATADGSGNWSLAGVALAEGANALTATATDAAGNTGSASSAFVATLDQTAPAETSFSATDPLLTNANSVHYTVTFSEAVADVDASQFALVTSGVSGASIASVTEVAGSGGTQYSVAVHTGAGDGTVQLNFVGAGVADIAGNLLPGGTFQAPAVYTSGIGAPQLGDVNGDGKSDIVGFSSDMISVQLGNGDGTFQAASTYASGGDPYLNAIAMGDVNGDGFVDVVKTNINSNTVSVLFGNGDGSFQSPNLYATGQGPSDLALGDLNGDGAIDIAISNQLESTISVLFNNTDGTFAPQVTEAVGTGPVGMAITDLNGDGNEDIIAAIDHGTTVSVLLGNGDGTFQPQVNYYAGSGPVDVVAQDLNGDEIPDLFVVDQDGSQNTLAVLIGNGDGTFQPATIYSTGGIGPAQGTVTDLNGDGNPDLVVPNSQSATIGVLLGNGDGTFQAATTYSNAGTAQAAAGDVNGDGRADIVDNTSVIINTPPTIAGDTYTIDKSAPSGWQFSLDNSNFDGASSIAAGTVIGSVLATGEANPGVTYYFATDASGAGATQALSGLSIDASTGVISTTAAISSSSSTWLIAEDAVGNKFAQQFKVSVGTSAANNVAVAAGTTVTFGLGGVDTVTGTSGGDAISGGSGNDILNGGAGNDSLNGGVGNDTLNGGADSDILLGGVGNDVLHGDDGDDTIAIAGTDAQGDSFDGGSGSDTILVTGSTDVTLANFDAAASSIENWQGNGQGIIGTGAANTINLGGLTTIAGLAYVDGGGGNDVITGSNMNDDLRGGVGNDALNGLAGNDTLSGGAGNDALSGGDGDDVLVIAGTEAQGDTFDGGTGTDTIAATGATDVTLTSLDTAASSIETWQGNGFGILGTGAANTINLSNLGAITGLSYVDGGAGDDVITGSNLADDLRGGSANDTLSGLGGNDILTGGAGNDTVAGGEGDDTISVAGTDALGDSFDGGAGSDEILVAGAADLTLANFNAATSSIERWRGNGKALIGNSANNAFDLSALVAVASLLYVDGGSGNDFIIGTALADVSDDLRGGTGDDSISGLAGNDVINGGAGNDALSGGDGDDTFLIAGTEARGDAIDGGSGLDKILVSGAADVSLTSFDTAASSIEAWQGNGAAIVGTTAADTINLSGLATVSGLSFLDGGGGDDLVTGTNFADDLRGGAGNDTLTGLAGNDVLNGGAGNDTLSGGDGNDTLIGGAGNDVQLGGDGDDTFVIAGTDAQADTIDGGIGTDAVSVTGAGNATLSNFNASTSSIELWQGNGQGVVATGVADTINIGGLTGVSGLTFIDGGGGNDAITGANLAPVSDDLRGGTGNDSLSGLAGNDTLNGAVGDDTLNGGAGADTLTGGTGKDLFVYLSANEGGDTMIGFVVADDTIQISAAGFGGGLAAGQQLVTGANFISSTDPLATTAAGTFLYDSDGHDLLWDADGSSSGAALQVAHFDTAVALKADDFDIVA